MEKVVTTKKPRAKRTYKKKVKNTSENIDNAIPKKKFMEDSEIRDCMRLGYDRTIARLNMNIVEYELKCEMLSLQLSKAIEQQKLEQTFSRLQQIIAIEKDTAKLEMIKRDLKIAELQLDNFNKDVLYREHAVIPSRKNMCESFNKAYMAKCTEVQEFMQRLATKYNIPMDKFSYKPQTGEIIEVAQ